MKTKNDYQIWIRHYEERRNNLRKQFPTWKNNPEYAIRSKQLTNKIRIWKEQIRRIEVRERRIKALAMQVCNFMEIPLLRNAYPLRNSVRSLDKKVIIARYLFYKYGMEHGLKSSWLSAWVGGTTITTASAARMKFTRSFKNNSENKRIWDHFKTYLKINDISVFMSDDDKMEAA